MKNIPLRIIPYIILLAYPALGLIANNQGQSSNQIFQKWVISTLILFVLWRLYQYALSFPELVKRIILSLSLNIIFLGFVAALNFFLLNNNSSLLDEKLTTSAIIFKWTMASVTIFIFTYTLTEFERNKDLQLSNLNLQNENLKSQLDQLRKQVNPHFLFNSLSTLRTMISENDKNSEEYLLKLSDVYRQFLEKKDAHLNRLEEELEFVKSYLYLNEIRHEKAMFSSFDIQKKSENKFIPVFAIQVLVENAIKHNIVSSTKPLKIEIFQEDPFSITVKNNVQLKKSETESMGVGLENLRKRYELLGYEDGLIIDEKSDSYKVTLKVLSHEHFNN